MTSNSLIGMIVGLTAFAACSASGPADRDSDRKTDRDSLRGSAAVSASGPAADSVQTPTPGTDSAAAPIHVRHVRYYDLTGDGAAERITVTARGQRYDSLDVRLDIRSSKDSLLYLAHWNSRLYYVYTPLQGQTPASIERTVRRHLSRLISDSAFVRRYATDARGRRSEIDSNTVQYSIAEHLWRSEHKLPPTAPLPTSALSEIPARRVPPHQLAAILADVRGKPTFTYFAGGEATYTIAWSDGAGYFVTVWACC